MNHPVKSVQKGMRIIPVSVDGSAVAGGSDVTDGLLEGKHHVRITENSSGDYTFTFNTPFSRAPVIAITAITDVTTCRLKAHSATGFQVEQVGADQTTPEADADFHVLVCGFDASEENG